MMEGVVRAPSAFSITLVVLPSMMATHELVVPKSMPMILPMFFSGQSKKCLNDSEVGAVWTISSLNSLKLSLFCLF
jgi:hypothetical protein